MNKIECKCKQCEKTFYLFPSEIKKGGGKYCSRSCAMKYRNIHDNPTKDEKVREKISKNHADFSGKNNPMYGRRGKDAPSYIDGRNSFTGETYKKILLASGREQICEECGSKDNLHVHHRDKNHKNNDINNLAWVCVKCHNNIVHKHLRDEKGRFIS